MSLAPYASLSVWELTHKPSFGFPYAQSIARRKILGGRQPKYHSVMVSGCAAARQAGTRPHPPRRNEAELRNRLARRTAAQTCGISADSLIAGMHAFLADGPAAAVRPPKSAAFDRAARYKYAYNQRVDGFLKRSDKLVLRLKRTVRTCY